MVSGQNSIESNCGFCGKGNSRECYSTKSIDGDLFFIRHCRECGAYFLTPRPSLEQLERVYDDSYYGGEESKFSPFVEKLLDTFRKTRSRRVRRYVPAPARILDIGCGNGRFLNYLIQEGYEGYGIELPGKAAARASAIAGLKLKQGSLLPDDFPDNYFDAVSLWHVFEHLTEPRQTLEIIGSILKPGGYLFLSLPNIRSWQSRLFKGQWLHLDPPKHLFFFSPEQLINLLQEAGFMLCWKTTLSLEQNPFGIQQSLLNCLCSRRELLFEYLKGNSAYTANYSLPVLRFQKILAILTSPLFVLLAVIEFLFGAGGTMEMVFQKRVEKEWSERQF